ncbi:polyketide synthase dehydratase domain-containing protein, partial [Streptomyces sp. NRRL F-4707]|uniref:polyketide synthase dehydratase domain-containing protein n=1 Tax=Streptomyces sp. NRRL F-4707 TaxID=1519496 RepID=UPI000A9694E4
DLCIAAGDRAGCPVLDELVIQTPVVLPATLRIAVEAAGPDGQRPLTVHSRTATQWTPHATGTLSNRQPTHPPTATDTWPPTNAQPLQLTDAYERFATAGLHYGPAF